MASPLTERTCAHCGNVYQPSGRCQQYCRRRCTEAAWRAKNPNKLELKKAKERARYAAHPEYRRVKSSPSPQAREKRRAYQRQWRLDRALRDMPDDPFVREIMTAMYMLQSEAVRAGFALSREERTT